MIIIMIIKNGIIYIFCKIMLYIIFYKNEYKAKYIFKYKN